MKETDFSNKGKCRSCGKYATRLCDIITGTAKWAGHPPKNEDGKIPPNTPMEWNLTCDKPICEKCSIHLNEYMDICPDCFKEIKLKGGTKL